MDLLTPLVDDPRAWGAIAAANALSDVYAMGATPLFALNLVGWPRETLPLEMLGEVLKGGAEIAASAGCLIVGGHSIDDPEPKYGMAVVGEVHPDRMLTNAGGCAGDALILTKPLGTGILSTALKRDALLEAGMGEAVRSMTTLNAAAAQAAVKVGVSAATDVTGFGLLGHVLRICDASKVGAELAYDTLPVFPHVRNLAARGFISGGTRRNMEATEGRVTWADDLGETDRWVMVDAQTSGGLLLAVPRENEAELHAALAEAGVVGAVTIGRLVREPVGQVRVTRALEAR